MRKRKHDRAKHAGPQHWPIGAFKPNSIGRRSSHAVGLEPNSGDFAAERERLCARGRGMIREIGDLFYRGANRARISKLQ
jgi:hypothetical protein